LAFAGYAALKSFTASGGRRIVNPMRNSNARSELTCAACGKTFALPPGQPADASVSLAEEESARCARLQEIRQQRQALAARTQAGIVGVVGSDTLDTVDMIAQRKSLAQLDTSLRAQAEELAKIMAHVPGER
jgi:hypothetical protein